MRFYFWFVLRVKCEIPKRASTVTLEVNPTEHNKSILILLRVSPKLGDKVRPAWAGHLAKDSQRFPGSSINVKNADIV